jgi:hypothetical protein
MKIISNIRISVYEGEGLMKYVGQNHDETIKPNPAFAQCKQGMLQMKNLRTFECKKN